MMEVCFTHISRKANVNSYVIAKKGIGKKTRPISLLNFILVYLYSII